MSMLRFFAIVHGQVEGKAMPLDVRFEEAVEQLESLPRMFVEPDGSFVWVGQEADGTKWQVDGNLIDQGATLSHMEIRGGCPEEALEVLLRGIGWPELPVLFQLPKQGAILNEAEFRRRALEGRAE